jgi:NitT/TauT family transport system permease protein
MRRAGMFVLALVLVAALWELYKWAGPQDGGTLFGWTILPRANDQAMPHVWEMLSRYARPERRGSSAPILFAVLAGAWFTLRLALVGFALGTAVGLGLAILMARFRFVERGLLPWLVLSQTVPLIALAPLVVGWGGRLELFGVAWRPWMSVAVISAYLAFFPVAVGALRGLKSPSAESEELMRSYAAGEWKTLVKLRFPAAVPYLVPALKLGAAAAVIGAIVAEISTGTRGGIGRLIIEYTRQATSAPEKVYTAMIGAALLGLLVASLITAFDAVASRNRPREEIG